MLLGLESVIPNKTDKKIVRIDGILYEYSVARAKKDKRDNNKQVEKAEYYLKNPSKVMKRSKFLSNDGKKSFTINRAIIEKHRLLEGIKGYKTSINDLDNKLLITRYKDLWRVEQSFRIAKSDLEARPIYHRRENSIEYHILIVFTPSFLKALAFFRVYPSGIALAKKLFRSSGLALSGYLLQE